MRLPGGKQRRPAHLYQELCRQLLGRVPSRSVSTAYFKAFSLSFLFMSILDSLSSAEEWEKFLGYKKEKRQLSKKEEAQLESFIAEERYLPICAGFDFGYPEKKEITKLGSPKKRVVYSYGEDETWVLKFLAYLLYRYDGCLSDSCYSFRRNRTAKTAFDRILAVRDLGSMYSLKLDIHDYFNSIDTGQLIKTLEEIITDDEPLLSLLKDLLLLDRCIWQGEVIEEKRGAMAGVPLASFFANVYLKDLDLLFEERGVPYFRYSDDMIIFSETKEELGESFSLIEDFLREKGLTLNMSKYRMAGPGEAWDFLGFCYRNGQIDLADATVKKMILVTGESSTQVKVMTISTAPEMTLFFNSRIPRSILSLSFS